MSRRDVLLAGGAVLLLAVAIVRVAVPDRARLRPLSVEGCFAPSVHVEPGDRSIRETEWKPPDDVFVVGWHAWRKMPPGVVYFSELMLYDRSTQATLFVLTAAGTGAGEERDGVSGTMPAGSGYRALKGRPLTLRYTVENQGARAFESGGAGTLLYFVPVEGN